MNKEDIAVNYKHNGCNCCQAVLLSFSDELGINKDTLKILGAGFGAGMGCMKANCGALIGAVMVDDLMNKRRNSSSSRNILSHFESMCGAIKCADLKGIETGRMLCSCDDCVRNAVRIINK